VRDTYSYWVFTSITLYCNPTMFDVDMDHKIIHSFYIYYICLYTYDSFDIMLRIRKSNKGQ